MQEVILSLAPEPSAVTPHACTSATPNISWSSKHALPLTPPTLHMTCSCHYLNSFPIPLTWKLLQVHKYTIPLRVCSLHFVPFLITALLTLCNNWFICMITFHIKPCTYWKQIAYSASPVPSTHQLILGTPGMNDWVNELMTQWGTDEAFDSTCFTHSSNSLHCTKYVNYG